MKAGDDAVADGMDIINRSLGPPAAPRLSDDIETAELERETGLGVLVVVSAGNGSNASNLGDPNTISRPGTSPSAITVGASFSDRIIYTGSVMVPAGPPVSPDTGYGTLPA